MGIPGLRVNLQPYAEPVYLGNGHGVGDQDVIRRIVIDGPGLVYYIYYRLLAWQHRGNSSLQAQPSCRDILAGVCLFLLEIRAQGVKV